MTAASSTHATVHVDGSVHLLDFGGPRGGDTPPLVLIHGLDGSAANWLDVGFALAADRRVVAPDLPGFGRTPLRGRAVDLPDVADHLADVVRQVTDRPVVLAGNSWGGPVALFTAARHPGLVDRVVLVAPALPRRARGPVDVPFAATFLLPYADHVAAWTAASRSLLAWMARPSAFHRLAARAGAVHVVEGGADPIIPTTSVARALERHPGWTHHVLPGVGHVPQLEDPDGFVAALRRVG